MRAENMREELKYEVDINWSPRDSLYVARVPELPGCMAHGHSYEEALANAQDAMRLWIATACEDGEPIPVPRSLTAAT
jgi:predicted RNase H-like HicB family nuclease